MSLSFYTFLYTLPKNPGKSVWLLFFFIFLSAFQVVLLYLYGHSIIAVDMFLNLITTNASEVGELLGNLLPSIALVIVVYVPVLVLGTMAWSKGVRMTGRTRMRMRTVSLGLVCLSTAMVSFMTVWGGYRATDKLFPLNVCYNLKLAIERTIATAHYEESVHSFRFHARSTRPDSLPEIYVLVIGETARAENFGILGYPRNTTPCLSKIHGLVPFAHAYTQSNTTHKSVPMLLSEVSAANFDSIARVRSLITAFREAGFHTVFLSNQLPNHSFIDFFGNEAEEHTFIKELPSHRTHMERTPDEALLPLMRKAIAGPCQKTLLVLHTYGSHFCYRERYPRSEAQFLPDDKAEAEACNRRELTNAYDNSILATDRFLSCLMQEIESKNVPAALVYASDHGENIFDDGREQFLHASPIPTWHELKVPLLLWFSSSYREAFPVYYAAAQSNSALRVQTSESVFHTLLHAAGLATPRLQEAQALTSSGFRPTPPSYLNDRNRPMPLPELGMSEEDLSHLDL